MTPTSDLNDMSLIELFQLETKNQCENLSHCLSSLLIGIPNQTNFDVFQRAIHSIKGAARIVDLQPVIDLTKSMELVLQGNRDELFRNIELQHCFEECVEQLNNLTRIRPDQIDETIIERKTILKRLERFLASFTSQFTPKKSHPGQPGHSAVYEEDDFSNVELFKIFREDAENQIAILSDNLIEIEKDPTVYTLLESSMRTVHSLKGAARVIELRQIVQLAHIMEDFFIAAQEKKLLIASHHIDVLLSAVDFIKDLIQIDKNKVNLWLKRHADKLAAIIGKLAGFLSQAISVPPDEDLASDLTAAEFASASTETLDKSLPPAPLQDSSFNLDNDEMQPLQFRTLRVSAQSINRMMGMAGEAMIESRWLPQFSDKLYRLRHLQNSVCQSFERLKNHLVESAQTPYLESSFSDISKKLGICSQFLATNISDAEDHSIKATNVFHRLHREIINNRMQPFSEGVVGLSRLIRDLGRKQNKDIQFEVVGTGTLVDRDILEKIESPLNHIITNAIDHGVEPPEERQQRGKAARATIRIEAKHQSGKLYITISDDGRGIDFEKIREIIVEKKLVSKNIADELTEYELQEFLFLPSFSTKSQATRTSGRGVGLDIVHSSINEIRGSVQVFSVLGKGTYFELVLPLTLSIIRGVIAHINSEPYSFPLVNINSVIRLPRTKIKEISNRQYLFSNNKKVEIVSAQQILDLEEQGSADETLSIIVVDSLVQTYGISVDSLHGIRDLVIQPINPSLGKLKSISAAAIGDDGIPILILDIPDMVLSVDKLISGERLKRIEPKIPVEKKIRYKRILVVDDSVTVREVERKILSDHGFQVETAIDGVDAWDKIQKFHYDLIVTDIDMPNMDGIELVAHVKDSQHFKNIPIIVVSYKDNKQDKNKGLDAGADYYLTKSNFHNQTLIDATEDLIGSPFEDV
jgi:two-component system sensor histidine kinase and response regulator WspE